MHNLDSFVDIKETCEVTGKSDSTVRRYVNQFKEDPNRIRNEINKRGVAKYVIEINLFNEHFKGSRDLGQEPPKKTVSSSQNDGQSDEQVTNETTHALMVLEKQHKDTIDSLLQQLDKQKTATTPLHRHSTVWAGIVAIVIITALVYGGYKYIGHQNQENTIKLKASAQAYQEKLNSQKQIFNLRQETSQDKINSLNQQLQEEKLKKIAPIENNPDGSSLTYLQ